MSAHERPSPAASALDAIRQSRIRFNYTNCRALVLAVGVDMEVAVEVVGDPENACYEWVIRRGASVEKHSDVGYGSSDIALRDGLIAYHGLPGAHKESTGPDANAELAPHARAALSTMRHAATRLDLAADHLPQSMRDELRTSAKQLRDARERIAAELAAAPRAAVVNALTSALADVLPLVDRCGEKRQSDVIREALAAASGGAA